MARTGKRAPLQRGSKEPSKRERAQGFDTPYRDAIAALEGAPHEITLEIDREPVKLTRLDKVLWPGDRNLPQYTRRDYLRYLLQVGPCMLPHMRDRPLTLIRMPEGITGRRFVHFHYEQRLPRYVQTVMIFSEKNKRPEEFLMCNNMATLLWLAHIGTLELHVWHSRGRADTANADFTSSAKSLQASVLNFPDYIVFDLDPYIYSGKEAPGEQPELNTRAFAKSKHIALELKALFDSMNVEAYVKTSGKTGLHVLVPSARKVDYDAARRFAHAIAQHIVQKHPEDVTIDWDVKRRTGKVFLDYNMNVRVKTLSAPYSVRGLPGAPVSMPLTWKELEKAHPFDFTMENVPALLASRGDIWKDMLELEQDLAKVISR
jgi:bifunctional non-homologous end joining protein LigD